MVIGVAFSGPYQQTREAIVQPGQSVAIGEYSFVFRDTVEGSTPAMGFVEARIAVSKAGRDLGVLTPQRRMYKNFPQPFAEVSTLPGLGDELYVTLVSIARDGSASLKISVNPLINWIWIGGTILCLAPLLCLQRYRQVQAGSRAENQAGPAGTGA
jgi:cytochrome c-type biogenesis protein CcmF